MNRTKVFQSLNKFSGGDLIEFRAYLRGKRKVSKYHQKMLSLFIRFRGTQVSNEEFAAELVGKKSISPKQFAKIRSAFLREIRKFKAWRELSKNELLLTYLDLSSQKDEPGNYRAQTVFSGIQRLNQLPKNAEWYYFRSCIFQSRIDCSLEFGRVSKDVALLQGMEDLEVAYTLQKLRYLNRAVRSDSLGNEDRFGLLHASEKEFLKGAGRMAKRNFLVSMYLNLYELTLDRSNHTLYSDCAESLRKNQAEIAQNDLLEFHVLLLSFCLFQVNAGMSKYKAWALEHAKMIFDEGLVIEKGEVSAGNFHLLFQGFLLSGEKVWAEMVLSEYCDLLPKQVPASIVEHYRGVLLMEDKKYSEALPIFSRLRKEGLGDYYKIEASLNAWKCMLWLQKKDELLQWEEAYRKMIQRGGRVSVQYIQSRTRFFKLSCEVVRILWGTEEEGKIRLRKLKGKLAKAGNTPLEEWLWELVEGIWGRGGGNP